MNRDQAFTKIERNMLYKGNSPSTVKMYQFYLNSLFDHFDKDDISLITPDDCVDFIIYLKKEGHYAHSSLNLMIASYRYFFEVVLARPLTHRQLPSLNLVEKDFPIFEPNEIQLLLDHADIKMKAMIVLGFDCGLRVSEVAKLKCTDIDSENMLIKIHNSKRGHSRTVKLSPFVLETLRSYWKIYRPSTDYFFTRKDNSDSINPIIINNSFRMLLTNTGLHEKGVRFHSLRHTYATMMLKHGCDPFLLRKLLGHKSFSSTARYIHMDTTDISKAFSISDKIGVSI